MRPVTASSALPLEAGQHVYLKLPGREAPKSTVAWVDGEKAGFQFVAPLHPAALDQLVSQDRKPIPRGHFGPRRFAR